MTSWSTVDWSDLVYGLGDDGIGMIVLPRHKAVHLAAVVEAFETARTWGALRERLPAGEWAVLTEMFEWDHDGFPAETDAFDPGMVGMYSDGDYPDWPAQRAFDWMPAEIVDAYGVDETSSLNGEFLVIPVENAPAVVAAFRARGVRIERDDYLALRASRFELEQAVRDGGGAPAGA